MISSIGLSKVIHHCSRSTSQLREVRSTDNQAKVYVRSTIEVVVDWNHCGQCDFGSEDMRSGFLVEKAKGYERHRRFEELAGLDIVDIWRI